MKFASVVTTTACLLVAIANAIDTTTNNNGVLSAAEALHVVEKLDLPAGVTLTGTTEMLTGTTETEMLQMPLATAKKTESVDATTTAESDVATKDQEQFIGNGFGGGFGGIGGGLGGLGLGRFGGFGGFGGFGPYRFGFSCGGLGGWAYPLGYWNSFGSGIWGGGCGLGIASGGLYYC
jgi:hypothetical protein